MEESLKAASELRRDGNLVESNRLLDELISQHPEHAMLHYECAWSCDILKQEDAISLYQRALKLGLPKKEAINAYVQTGSLYRQLGQFTESKKILMEGMLRFWDVGLQKVFYAFTMYDLGNPGEAMRWMTHAILDSAKDQEIF